MTQMNEFLLAHPLLLIAIIAWSVAWKGMALWRAAKLNSKPWFIALLIINTAGLLEIVYIYVISKKKTQNM